MNKTLLLITFTWQRLQKRVDGQPLKTRLIILLSICFGMAFFFFVLWLMPMLSANKIANSEIKRLSVELGMQQSDFDATVGKQQKAEVEAKKKMESAGKQLLSLNQTIEDSLGTLKPVDSAISTLQTTLSQPDLQLISLKKLAMRPYKGDAAQKSSGALYQQVIQLTFKGNYYSTMAFLQALESKKWPWSWDSLQYQVDTYPSATIQLQLSVFTIGGGGDV